MLTWRATHILNLSPTHLVTNSRHQYQFKLSMFLDRLLSSLFIFQLFFFRPSTFSLLGRPLRSFWTVYFHPLWLFSFLPLDRPVFLLSDRPLWPKNVNFKPDPVRLIFVRLVIVRNLFSYKVISEVQNLNKLMHDMRFSWFQSRIRKRWRHQTYRLHHLENIWI